MLDDDLIAVLAEAPPSRWNTLIARRSALDFYLAKSNRGVADVDHLAASVGLTRRQAYRLIEGRQQEMDSQKRIRKNRPGNRMSTERASLLRDAITKVSCGALISEVTNKVNELSIERGLVSPSVGIISRQMDATYRFSRLSARVGPNVRWIIDASLTNIVAGEPGEVYFAYIVALLDCEHRSIHVELCRTVAEFPLHNVVADFDDPSVACPAAPTGVIITSRVLQAFDETSLRSIGPILKPAPAFMRRGEAIKMILGRRLGQIAIKSEPRATTLPKPEEAVPLPLADRVVASLLHFSKADAVEKVV